MAIPVIAVQVGVRNGKGRDHAQGIILHGVTQVQQLQNRTQRIRSDAGSLTVAGRPPSAAGFPGTRRVNAFDFE